MGRVGRPVPRIVGRAATLYDTTLPNAITFSPRKNPVAPKRYYAKKKRPKKETYEQRNILLRELGYPTYALYLQSQLWSFIRHHAYRIHGSCCRLCPRRATTIHHLSYTRDVLLGNDLSLLAPLCHRCHNQVEFGGKHKRTIASSQRHYYKLLYARISQLKRISSLNTSATI